MDVKSASPRPRPWPPRVGVCILLLLFSLGCGRDDGASSSGISTPTASTSSSHARAARRVASLSPVATALILELAMGSRIVAVDAESAELPGLAHRPRIPETEDAAFRALLALEPDLVVLPATRIALSERLNTENVRTVFVLIHDFDDGFTLWGEIAGQLGLAEASRSRIAEASRPLAAIAAESYGFSRPRVAVIGSFDPLVLVGDHRFETALVEIAGGENVTHGRGEASIPIDRDGLRALAPALLFHASPRPPDERERRALADSLADVAPLVVAEFDPARFYAPETVATVRALRAAIAPRAQPLEAESPGGADGAGAARGPGDARP